MLQPLLHAAKREAQPRLCEVLGLPEIVLGLQDPDKLEEAGQLQLLAGN